MGVKVSDHSEPDQYEREKRRTFLGFIIFSALSIIGWFFLDVPASVSPLFLVAAFFCAGLAIFAWLSMRKNWTNDEEGEYIGTLFVWIVALVLGWWLLRLAAGWL